MPGRRPALDLARLTAASLLAASLLACGGQPPSPSATLLPTPTPVDAPVASDLLPVPGNLAAHLGPWSATPFQVDPALRAALDRACRGALAIGRFTGDAHLVLIDARGAGLAQAHYWGATNDEATCNDLRINRDGTILAMGAMNWTTDAGPFDPADPLELRIRDVGGSGDPVTSAYVFGLAGPGIVRVVIEQPTRPSVLATLGNGWFGAWVQSEWEIGWQVVGFDSLGNRATVIPGL